MNEKIKKLCLGIGIALFAVAAGWLLVWQGSVHVAKNQAARTVETLSSLLPEPQGAAPEERTDNAMPVLPLKGTDYVALLEMPAYGLCLPVADRWGSTSRQPCRYSGSVYDGSLKLGATSQAGQFAFYREISVGDSLYLTDMSGSRYRFQVADIRYVDEVDEQALSRDASVVIFIYNVYGWDNIVLYCQ